MSQINIRFPDQSVKTFEKGITPLSIAQSISRGLAEKCVVADVNGKQVDLTTPINEDASIKLLTMDTPEGMQVFWHSSAHVMAQAVKRLWPEAKFEDGPPTEAGFFYDILLPHTISQEDFPKIEAEMEKISKEKLSYSRKELSRSEAMEFFKSIGQDFKLDIIQNIPDGQTISSYTQGEFTDLCRGPHIPHTGLIKAFKVMSVAGAFYKGDENNIQLQRLRAISFPSKKQLDEYLAMLEEAKRRDHRKLGQELELFYITSKVGGGLPLWLPNGTILRETLVDFLREEQKKQGYQPVVTPHIGNIDLYKTSGHYPYYKDSQFAPITLEDGEQFLLKPMNCPHHIQIYASKPRSYRDLPIRLAEFGTVYRYEQSGELTGLTRVRGFTVDDSHLFVRPDQVKEEMCRVIGLIQFVFETLGFKDFRTRLSFRDDHNEKYGGEIALWEKAQQDIQEAADAMKLNYFIGIGEAAFYGPKIDFMIKDVLGRTWQLGTVQLDYVLPERFKIEYTGADGQKHRPIMIHRAPFGSLERFIGILIEQYAGNFPVWLAPVQVAILPISDSHAAYSEQLKEQFESEKIRATIDARNEKIGYKIREAEMKKIPYILVIGDKEVAENKVAVRRHGKGDQGAVTLENFINDIREKIDSKSQD
ncbi:threonine--tRNA ligase [bacterium]|nr:threonine--tRNA ligase [bacterium]